MLYSCIQSSHSIANQNRIRKPWRRKGVVLQHNAFSPPTASDQNRHRKRKPRSEINRPIIWHTPHG